MRTLILISAPRCLLIHIRIFRAHRLQYWEQKKLEYAIADGRRLSEKLSMGEWILAVRCYALFREVVAVVASKSDALLNYNHALNQGQQHRL